MEYKLLATHGELEGWMMLGLSAGCEYGYHSLGMHVVSTQPYPTIPISSLALFSHLMQLLRILAVSKAQLA